MSTRAGTRVAGRWPVWTVPAGLILGAIVGSLAGVILILPLAAIGVGDGAEGGILLPFVSIGFGVGLLGTIALLVRSSEPLSARTLGLRPAALGPAMAWTATGGALIAAGVFCLAQVTDLSDLFAVPSELDARSSLARQLDLGQAPDRADAGLSAFASALGRVVIPAVLAEVVLRGFALHTLARWRGEPLALAVTAVLTIAPVAFALDNPRGAGALIPIALLLGVVLGLLYLRTGSLLPGSALSAAVMGAGLGAAFAWSPLGIALLSAGCCAAALTIAAPIAMRSRERSA